MTFSVATPVASLLPLVPLGLAAGLLAGVLGIGGGLVFSPLLLLAGLDPHQALATSTLAIVPTTCGAAWVHLRQRMLPWRGATAIVAGALLTGALFSRMGGRLEGWLLLALQALMYLALSVTITSRSALGPADQEVNPIPLPGLTAVGAVAGLASGLLGVGGGLVMVPLMVRCLRVPIHQAVRFSTLAVLASAISASEAFLTDGRANLSMGLLLGGTAAVAARWSAARLQRISEARLILMLRCLTALLMLDSGRRAIGQLLAG